MPTMENKMKSLTLALVGVAIFTAIIVAVGGPLGAALVTLHKAFTL